MNSSELRSLYDHYVMPTYGRFDLTIERAQSQQAKTLELRAALALARLQLARGRRDEAQRLLAPLTAWFQQEGQYLPELDHARMLLSV